MSARAARRRRQQQPQGRVWQPMTRAAWVSSRAMAAFRASPAELAAMHEMWVNDQYTVIVERFEDGSVYHLSIRRNDRAPARDWRDFMRIKDEIAGPEAEGVELYPARSRIVDMANQYHMWFLPGGRPFPLGYASGSVSSSAKAWPGAVQRPLDEPAG